MTKILHILDHSLPLHSGYSFRTRAIIKAQLRAGWDVKAITGMRHQRNSGNEDMDNSKPEMENIDGLDFYRSYGKTSSIPLIREWQEVNILADNIVKKAQKLQPDILHAHSPMLNGLAGLKAAKKLGLPLIYEIRAFWEDAAVGNGTGTEGSINYKITRTLETHVAKKADGIAVICQGLKDDLVKRGIIPDKIIISPNGVDMDQFGDSMAADPVLISQYQLEGCDILGFIGSFYDYEGLDDLVRAMPHITAQNDKIRLFLIGSGPVYADIEKMVASLNLEKYIIMPGRVPHDEVSRWYAMIDIMVYPRKAMRLTHLVTPLKPLEAMAQNKLVIASDVGGHKELITTGKTGELYQAGNSNALANAILHLIANKADWDKRKKTARQYIEQERDWDRNIYCYQDIYHSLLKI